MSPPESASMFGSHSSSNGCVMVIEEEPSVREHIRRKLQGAGYDVVEVADGDKAVEAINSGENPLVVDIVIADIPKEKRMETVTYFRQHFPRLPLIGLTGLPRLERGSTQRTRIAILGAGKGGDALLGLLSHLPGVEIIGITDKNPNAPALTRARALSIPVVDNAARLISSAEVNLIIDVTGNPDMQEVIAQHKSAATEVLGGAAAKLLWDLVQHEGEMQSHVSETDKFAHMVKTGMIVDYLTKPVDERALIGSVTKAMDQREIHRL